MGELAAGGSLGKFELVREIARGPGLWIFETTGSQGEPVLLEVAPLRAVTTDEERESRAQFERRLSAATSVLVATDPSSVVVHGAVDDALERRVLFWALPFPPESKLAPPAGSSELAEIGIALARRLAERHPGGSFDPHLSERALIAGSDPRSISLLGLPFVLASPWLDEQMIPTRLAPEELESGRCTAAGDLWRLGETLRGLASELERSASPRIYALIDGLTRPDPSRRICRAAEAIVELEAVLFELRASPRQSHQTVRLETLSPDRLAELLLESSGDSTRVEAASPLDIDFFLPDDAGDTIRAVTMWPLEPAPPPPLIIESAVEEPPPRPTEPPPPMEARALDDSDVYDAVEVQRLGLGWDVWIAVLSIAACIGTAIWALLDLAR